MVDTAKQFVAESKRRLMIDERLETLYRKAGYERVFITKVPLGHQITIYAEKPGIIIGKKGASIRDVSALLEQEYKLENPQIEVRPVEVPELSSKVMAYRMRLYLERGLAHKRIVFSTLDAVMRAGADGTEVSLRGKFTTERSRFVKLRKGQIHQSGDPANYNDVAVTNVLLKPGIIGIKVKIAKPAVFKPQLTIHEPNPAMLSALRKEKGLTLPPQEGTTSEPTAEPTVLPSADASEGVIVAPEGRHSVDSTSAEPEEPQTYQVAEQK
jgi:small subunit ribosomal protein S3